MCIGITAIFFVLATVSVCVSATSLEAQNNLGIRYAVVGRISSYQVIDGHNGTQYLECKAIRVRAFFQGVFPNFPTLTIRQTIRLGHEFAIPFEGAKISGPNLLGNYFLVATGIL